MKDITIFPVANGFIVKAGCQLLAYENREKLKADLGMYVDNPDKAEMEIMQRLGLNVPMAPTRNLAAGQACNEASMCDDSTRSATESPSSMALRALQRR